MSSHHHPSEEIEDYVRPSGFGGWPSIRRTKPSRYPSRSLEHHDLSGGPSHCHWWSSLAHNVVGEEQEEFDDHPDHDDHNREDFDCGSDEKQQRIRQLEIERQRLEACLYSKETTIRLLESQMTSSVADVPTTGGLVHTGGYPPSQQHASTQPHYHHHIHHQLHQSSPEHHTMSATQAQHFRINSSGGTTIPRQQQGTVTQRDRNPSHHTIDRHVLVDNPYVPYQVKKN